MITVSGPISQPVQRPAEKVSRTVALAGKPVVGATLVRLSGPITDSMPTGPSMACSASMLWNWAALSRPPAALARDRASSASSITPGEEGQ